MHIPTKQLEGRDHLVVPVVMLTVGVHSGSRGPVFYPAHELKNSASLWNGRPVVVYHPALYGDGSAGKPVCGRPASLDAAQKLFHNTGLHQYGSPVETGSSESLCPDCCCIGKLNCHCRFLVGRSIPGVFEIDVSYWPRRGSNPHVQ